MRMRRVLAVLPMVVLLIFALLAGGWREAPAETGGGAPSAARKAPVVDRYHGVEVVDEYRWPEDWNDPAVKAWSEAQKAHAYSVLDRLPGVEVIRVR